jgi:N-acetylglucosamine repressor
MSGIIANFHPMPRPNKSRRKSRSAPRRLKIKQKFVANLEAELLRHVRAKEGLSRVDLARQLSLAPSTVGAYVDRLITEGFLFEGRKAEREFGRPPTLLALNPQGGRFIGVDFEAHNIMATVVDFSQQPMRQLHQVIKPEETVEQIIQKIESVIEELMDDHVREVLGIGVGVPGVIDPKRQVAVRYPHIQGWENIDLGRRLRERFKVDVYLENNIRSMALAELWFGEGRGLDNFICLGIRTGIGAGIIARGQLLHGENNLAGEIRGWLSPSGVIKRRASAGGQHVWTCGQLQPLEQIASVPAILEAMQSAMAAGAATILRAREGIVSFDDVLKAARAGDELVREVLHRVAWTLGWVVCQMNALFNPKKIILAGPLATLGKSFLEPLQGAVNEFCSELRQEPPTVVDSELGAFNGALGAAALALHEWKPKR